jgi:hypothetical protein
MTDALRKARIELEAEHQPQYVHHDGRGWSGITLRDGRDVT